MPNRHSVRQEVTFACSCTQIITKLCKLNQCHTSGTLSLISHGRAPDSIPLLSICKTWHLFRNFVRIPYILESNPHSVFGDFLNGKKLV